MEEKLLNSHHWSQLESPRSSQLQFTGSSQEMSMSQSLLHPSAGGAQDVAQSQFSRNLPGNSRDMQSLFSRQARPSSQDPISQSFLHKSAGVMQDMSQPQLPSSLPGNSQDRQLLFTRQALPGSQDALSQSSMGRELPSNSLDHMVRSKVANSRFTNVNNQTRPSQLDQQYSQQQQLEIALNSLQQQQQQLQLQQLNLNHRPLSSVLPSNQPILPGYQESHVNSRYSGHGFSENFSVGSSFPLSSFDAIGSLPSSQKVPVQPAMNLMQPPPGPSTVPVSQYTSNARNLDARLLAEANSSAPEIMASNLSLSQHSSSSAPQSQMSASIFPPTPTLTPVEVTFKVPSLQ